MLSLHAEATKLLVTCKYFMHSLYLSEPILSRTSRAACHPQLGFTMGNPRARFSSTVPEPVYTLPVAGRRGTNRTRRFVLFHHPMQPRESITCVNCRSHAFREVIMGAVDGMLFFLVVQSRGVLTVMMTATIPVVSRHSVTRNPRYQWYPAGLCFHHPMPPRKSVTCVN